MRLWCSIKSNRDLKLRAYVSVSSKVSHRLGLLVDLEPLTRRLVRIAMSFARRGEAKLSNSGLASWRLSALRAFALGFQFFGNSLAEI